MHFCASRRFDLVFGTCSVNHRTSRPVILKYYLLILDIQFQEEELDHAITYTWRGFGSDCESELARYPRDVIMADERRVPGACDGFGSPHTDQTVPAALDQIDGTRNLKIHTYINFNSGINPNI